MIEDLIPDNADHLEALLASYAVDNHIPVDADEVFGVEYCVFVLSGGIDHLRRKVLVLVPNDFGEGVLNGGIVGVDKVSVDVLDRQ